jgi:hypothetical protein
MIFFLVIITMTIDSIDQTVTESIFIQNIGTDQPQGFVAILEFIWGYIQLFFRIIFFQVEGIPAIFNLVIFYPLTAATLYMLIDIIRGNS